MHVLVYALAGASDGHDNILKEATFHLVLRISGGSSDGGKGGEGLGSGCGYDCDCDMQGQGVLTWPDGQKDGGEWKGGEEHGKDVCGPVQNTMVDMQNLVRELLKVPAGYSTLIMHGGAHQQFSAVPLNTCSNMGTDKADVVDGGYWTARAMGHAAKYCDCKIVCTNRLTLNDVPTWEVREDAKYMHICHNGTISGLEYTYDPDLAAHPYLACDATSALFSRPYDISKYGCILASSGKNLGPAARATRAARAARGWEVDEMGG